LVNLGLSILNISAAIGLLGLPSGVARFIALYRANRDEQRSESILLTALLISTLSGSIIGIILFLGADFISDKIFHSPELGPIVEIFAFTVLFRVLLGILAAGQRGFENMAYVALSQNIIPLGGLFLMILIFWYLRFPVSTLPYAYLISAMGATLAAFLFSRRYVRPSDLLSSGTMKNARQLLAFSWPLMISGILFQLRYQADKLFLGSFLNPTQVGFYSAAIPIMWGLLLVNGAFTPPMLPLLTRLQGTGAQQEFETVFRAVNRWIFYVSFPLISLVALFPRPIVLLVFGSQYLAAVPVVRILALGALMFYLSGIGGSVLNAIGETRIVLLVEVAGAGTNLLLNYLLIPRLGIEGAAWATLASFLINSLLVIAFIKRKIGFWILDSKWLRYGGSFLLTFLLLSLLTTRIAHSTFDETGLTLLVAAVATMVVGIVVGLKVAGLKPEDWMILKTVGKRIGILRTTNDE
jgi:O-antigen/teichoic acid export membrane protein